MSCVDVYIIINNVACILIFILSQLIQLFLSQHIPLLESCIFNILPAADKYVITIDK